MHPNQADYRSIEFQGIVVANDAQAQDGLKLRRIRIQCPQLWGNTPTDSLPWAIQATATNLGGIATEGTFAVPAIGTTVCFVLDQGEILAPIYTGVIQDSTTHMALFDTNYPNRVGTLLADGTQFYIDKTTKTFHFTHGNSGSTVDITSAGEFDIVTKGKLQINITGDCNITASGNVNIVGAIINLGNSALQYLCTAAFKVWAASHTHTSESPGSPTSPPIMPPPGNSLTTIVLGE